MTYLAVLTAAGLIAAVTVKEVSDLRRLRPAVIPTHPAHQPFDRIR